MATISAEKDSLLNMVVDNTQLMNEINNELNKVKDLKTGVVPVTGSEAGTTDTVRVQDYLLAKVREVTERVSNSESRLAASQRRIRGLAREGDTLRSNITEFQSTVARFQAIIDTQKVTILSLTHQINDLQSSNVKLVARTEALAGTVDTLTTERNTVFYVVGRKNDLVQRGIATEEGSKFLVFGGKSLQPARNLDASVFTQADLRELSVIELPDSTRKYKIISRQNLAGLASPPQDGKFRGTFEIRDPALFWGPSWYLIIVQD
jgi:cell division protein FtsB